MPPATSRRLGPEEFSLMHQDDASVLPWLFQQRIGYLAYAPLSFGIFTGTITASTAFPAEDWRSGPMGEELFSPAARLRWLEAVRRAQAAARESGTSLASVALLSAVEQPGVTAAIAGSRDVSHP